MDPIYLDYNATTPVDPAVLSAMMPYFSMYYGNPSSSHSFGVSARAAIENAREQVARMIGSNPDEVIFTSGGTESNNLAIQGAAYACRNRGNHLIISAVEHPAVAEVAAYLQQNGFDVSVVPVDSTGRVNPFDIESLIRPSTTLISVMHANNEVGTIQPVREIAEIAHRYQIIVHTDAAQSIGKIPVDITELGVDLLTIAGHKLYAPKGIGALYIKRGVVLEKFVHGADHEYNLRPGTENVPLIVALGKACELVTENISGYFSSLKETREILANGLLELLPDLRINGHPDFCLPNTLSVSFKGTGAKAIMPHLPEVALSAGAACHSATGVSGTLDAMNLPPEYSFGAIRISSGRYTTTEEAGRAVEMIAAAVEKAQYLKGSASHTLLSPTKPLIDAAGSVTEIRRPVFKDTAKTETNKLQTSITETRITQFDAGLGCGCKMKPGDLEYILKNLPTNLTGNVLVATETRDDAAVWKINDNETIVQTVDFFTPMIDDPWQFGAIAAANALSDIYAMGAKPIFALNLVAFPTDRLPLDILKEIIRGASDKALEAGIPVLGGHSVEDTGIKFGMVVTGKASPREIITNAGARTGDLLILTKPLGTGILTKALYKEMITPDDEAIVRCIRAMMTLNRYAAMIMHDHPVNACTDITGFGLSGHLHEMLQASATNADLWYGKIPLFPGVEKFARMGVIPGSTSSNQSYSASWMEDTVLKPYQVAIICDSQTSGGLLISIPESDAEPLVQDLKNNGINAEIIGRVTGKGDGKINCKY
ncbi:MAG TPA: selenide, water dikinase SelD [Lentimicrobium sp.]|nr:selenide, water dikinase SelD [Lentimicrobium sp.]